MDSALGQWSLSDQSRNRLLLVGLGLTTVFVVRWAHSWLEDHRDRAQTTVNHARRQFINQATEDAIKSQTLEKLIESPNYGIAEIASRIVLDRALHTPEVLDELLWECTRPDHDRRERGIRALHLLTESSQSYILPYVCRWRLLTPIVYAIKQLDTPKTYSAIVKALEYCVTDVPHDDFDPDFESFDFRDACERRALSLVWRLSSEFKMGGFIRAGFVPRWLAKEPLGKTEKERQNNFARLYKGSAMLSGIVTRVGYDQLGREQLYKAKLISNPTTLFDDTIDVRMVNGEGTAGEMLMSHTAVDGAEPRLREFSPEERNMRRRHREAMVSNDGLQPIVDSDIIQREVTSPLVSGQLNI